MGLIIYKIERRELLVKKSVKKRNEKFCEIINKCGLCIRIQRDRLSLHN